MLEGLQPLQRRDEAAQLLALVAVDLQPGRDVGQGPRLAVRPRLGRLAVVPAASKWQDRGFGVHFAGDRVTPLDLGHHGAWHRGTVFATRTSALAGLPRHRPARPGGAVFP